MAIIQSTGSKEKKVIKLQGYLLKEVEDPSFSTKLI